MSNILMFILILVSLASAAASFAALIQGTRKTEREIVASKLERKIIKNIDKYIKEINEEKIKEKNRNDEEEV